MQYFLYTSYSRESKKYVGGGMVSILSGDRRDLDMGKKNMQ